MSLPNFANLTAEHPAQSPVWGRLERYFHDFPRRTIVAARWLVEDEPQLDPVDVSEAFAVLLEEGLATPFFQVAKQDGTLLRDRYASPQDIPRVVISRDGEHYYPLEELDVVPMFEIVR